MRNKGQTYQHSCGNGGRSAVLSFDVKTDQLSHRVRLTEISQGSISSQVPTHVPAQNGSK